MKKIKLLLIGLCTFFLPSFLLKFVLPFFGVKVGNKVKIGFSFILTDKVILAKNATIKNFNLIMVEDISLGENALIGSFNILKGPFKLILKKRAIIGSKNYVTRGKKGITYDEAVFQLGELGCITTKHHLDLTRSIVLGDFTTLAGISSQMWTHGYYHGENGEERVRIDGEILIGNNVYIGSGCIFNPKITIANAVHIGSGSVISKNLDKKGMYVGTGLRFIENDIENIKNKLTKVDKDLLDDVYEKI